MYFRIQAAEEEAKRKAAREKAADEAKRKVPGDLQPPTPLPSRSVKYDTCSYAYLPMRIDPGHAQYICMMYIVLSDL